MANNTIEAKLVADQLMQQGIPAIADKIDVNLDDGRFSTESVGIWSQGSRSTGRPAASPDLAERV